MTLTAGTRLGPYEVLGPIGAGGMGEVYRAHDPRLDRHVAIKVLPALLAADPDRVRRFEQEARAVGRLNHPNILAIHDVGQVPEGLPASGVPFLVSELLDGRTLREEMGGRALPLRTALDYAHQIASGLAAAHEKGVVHRDLKPENVFVTREGHVKILDFGLAKLRPDTDASEAATVANVTGPGVVMGTTGYMSPEQVRGQDADHRSDIFSFGSVLYEILTGRRAFQGGTGAEVMSAILHLEPPPLTAASGDRDIPAGVVRIVQRCLEKPVDRRFQSARDLAFSLEALDEAAGTRAPASAAPRASWLTPARLIPIVAAGLAAVAVGWFLWSRPTGSRLSSTFSGPPSVTPFLVGPAVETLPAWSPTGNLVAYVSEASGNDDVWMSDLTGTNPINLTKDHKGIDTFPAWAPDGQLVAFYSDREGGGIYTMTPLGANIRRVVPVRPSVVYTFSLQWARDGSIVYTNFDQVGDKQIYRVFANSANPVCLTCGRTAVPGARAGALSPSGALLAHVGTQTGPRALLYVLDLGSGRSTTLSDRADAPHWRDDSHIIFLSARDGLPDLWEVDVNPRSGIKEAEPVRITSGLDATAFAVSGDGRSMLAVKEKSTSTIWTFPSAPKRIDQLSQGTPVTTGDFRDGRPRWSADDREVFLESNRRGSVNIWKAGAAGGAPVRLTTGVGLEMRPRPSTDGRWVAFDHDGNWTWLMRPDGSGVHAPADWEARFSNVCCSAWSPDSSRMLLSVDPKSGGNRLALAEVEAASGMLTRIREIDVPGNLEQYPRWSPDGRGFAVETFAEGSFDVWVVNGDGTSPRRVTDLPSNERSAAWQASPLHLYFRSDAGYSIWRMPMADAFTPAGPPVEWLAIAGFRVLVDGIDVTRDSSRVVVALAKPESDIWLVERK